VAAEGFEPPTKGLTVPCVKQQLRNKASNYPQTSLTWCGVPPFERSSSYIWLLLYNREVQNVM